MGLDWLALYVLGFFAGYFVRAIMYARSDLKQMDEMSEQLTQAILEGDKKVGEAVENLKSYHDVLRKAYTEKYGELEDEPRPKNGV